MTTMLGFEEFQVSAWLDNGLIKQAPRKRTPSHSPRRTSAWRIAIALTLAGPATTLAAHMGIPQANISQTYTLWSTQQSASASLVQAEVPSDYWSKMMKEVGSWKKLEENSTVSPEPLI